MRAVCARCRFALLIQEALGKNLPISWLLTAKETGVLRAFQEVYWKTVAESSTWKQKVRVIRREDYETVARTTNEA